MAWSKASTSTQSFQVIAGDHGAVNAVSGTGTGVLEEFVAFLGTRGWTAVLDTYADTPATGDTRYIWTITKSFVCEDGGTQTLGWQLTYTEDASSTDDYSLTSYDPASGVAEGSHGSISVTNSSYNDHIGGKWSFWTSDEDGDSFLVIAEDTVEDTIIGFWPPSGSLFRQGYGGTTAGVANSGIKPLFIGTAPSWDAGNGATSVSLMANFTNDSYKSYMNDDELKTDFAWISNANGRPLFRSFGSDIGMFIQMGPSAADPTVASNIYLNGNVSVYQFGSDYHIAWGLGSKLLFNCGTTAPVF